MIRRRAFFSSNGHSKAPPDIGGASSAASPRNRRPEFPAEPPIDTLPAIYYAGRRFLLGGAPASRYLSIALAVIGAIWATGILPLRWAGVSVALVAMVAHIVTGFMLQRRDYVTVRQQPIPKPVARELALDTLLPVYVTGILSVEGNYQRFTCLPGFYRTFATREHALLCLVRPRRLLRFLRWPEHETGMWYAFFTAESLRSITFGTLEFEREPMAAIVVEYESCLENVGQFSKDAKKNCRVERLVVSSHDVDAIHTIIADLCADSDICGQEPSERLADVHGEESADGLGQWENTGASPT